MVQMRAWVGPARTPARVGKMMKAVRMGEEPQSEMRTLAVMWGHKSKRKEKRLRGKGKEIERERERERKREREREF